MLSMRIASLLLLLALPAASQQTRQGQIDITKFGGLNDTDAPALVPYYQAQDALNVESNYSGTSLLKRRGISLQYTATVATAPILGSARFIADSADIVDVLCYDRLCDKAVNGAGYSTFLTTATLGIKRWSFATVDGDLYGANDKYDHPFKYNATTLLYPPTMLQGSILALTPTRLAIINISGAPNRVCYSAEDDYTDFTAGVENEDSFCDDFGSNGEALTGAVYHNGLFYLFKSHSINACSLDNQYNTQCEIITETIGTEDPGSVVSTPKGIYFKAQNKEFWRLDGSNLESTSRDITTLVKSQTSGSVRAHNDSEQSDWDAGVQTPAGSWNTTTYPGSIFNSSAALVDQSSTDFYTNGTLVGVSTYTGVLRLSKIFPQVGAEDDVADVYYTHPSGWVHEGSYSWGVCSSVEYEHVTCPIFNSDYGNNAIVQMAAPCDTTPGASLVNIVIEVLNAADDSVLYRNDVNVAAATEYTIDTSTQSATNFKLRARLNYPGYPIYEGRRITSPSFSKVDEIRFYRGLAVLDQSPPNVYCQTFDLPTNYFVRSGTYTRVWDTSYSTPTWGIFKATYTLVDNSTLNFDIRVASSPYGVWTGTSTITTDARISTTSKRYIEYAARFISTKSTYSATLDAVELQAATTGQYQSACIEPGSSISGWGTLNCSETKTGLGSLIYYVRSGTACVYLATASWTAQSNNATIEIATAAAVEYRFDSGLGSSTDTAQVDSCIVNWSVGTVAQPAWATYSALDKSIFFSISINDSPTNNRVLKYDMEKKQWYPWNLTSNAPIILDNSYYFGSSTAGKWYKYGDVDNDGGSAINSYWKSADLASENPYQERQPTRISLIARNEPSGSLRLDWMNGRASSGTYNVALSTPNTGVQYIRHNYGVPQQSPSSYFNIKFGNNAANQPWEVLGLRFDFTEFPWRVLTP